MKNPVLHGVRASCCEESAVNIFCRVEYYKWPFLTGNQLL